MADSPTGSCAQQRTGLNQYTTSCIENWCSRMCSTQTRPYRRYCESPERALKALLYLPQMPCYHGQGVCGFRRLLRTTSELEKTENQRKFIPINTPRYIPDSFNRDDVKCTVSFFPFDAYRNSPTVFLLLFSSKQYTILSVELIR